AARIAVMKDGRVEQVGAPEFVYENPVNRFVAGFLGAINLFEGKVAASDGGSLLVETDVGRLAVKHAPLAAGTAVAVAVRPEKIQLAVTARSSSPNSLPGILRGVAYRGEASTCEVELPGGRLVRVTIPNSEAGTTSLLPGASLFLSFSPDAARVLQA
ncbi:MAG TPA: TOBE domain-containing protein, partial [Stellaceae bacterium]|nr:TOBE domain-containing protein [Stellaceae bacterium]